MGEEKRHQMMQNLFGDQSEEEEEEEEIDSEHESNPQPGYASDEGDKGTEAEGEGEGEVEGQGEAEVESEAELREVEPDPGESEGERDHVYEEVEAKDQREESDGRESDSEENQEYGQRATTNRRREVQYAESEDEEVDQSSRRSPSDEEEQPDGGHTTAEIRDVFGDSDEEEAAEYAVPNNNEHDSNRFPMEEEEEEEEGSYENNLQPEDMLADEDPQYASEEEPIESRHKEKPVGPPLDFEIPLKRPPAHPEKMNMIKVSNIMGIDPKPFDPKTYQEEDVFVTDESGSKKRIRLENNIVRWRMLKSRSGAVSYESNARFVKWSDGSVQLLIGNEVLDINVQDAQHEQAHLFLRHGKGILQSQGRLLQKMKVMPSSLTSNSHRLLTALVDSRHKKVYKVKNCVTDIDPEREKEEKERALSQTIRANAILNRKREKVNRKYTQNVDRGRQLSPGFLEEALDEDDEADYYETRRSRRNFEDELEIEARAEKRIMNAKKQQGHRDIPRKSSMPAAKPRRPVEFSESEREESEYETDGDEYERSPLHKRTEVEEPEYEDDEEEEHVQDDAEDNAAYSEDEEPKPRGTSSSKRKGIESDEESPPRKAPTNQRRKAFVYDSDEE